MHNSQAQSLNQRRDYIMSTVFLLIIETMQCCVLLHFYISSFLGHIALHDIRFGLTLPFKCGLSVCICWSQAWAVLKWLNWSRCCLGCFLMGQMKHVLDAGPHLPMGSNTFWDHAQTCPRSVYIFSVILQWTGVMQPLSTSLLWQLVYSVTKTSRLAACYFMCSVSAAANKWRTGTEPPIMGCICFFHLLQN